MTLNYIEGCTAYRLTIDGVEASELPPIPDCRCNSAPRRAVQRQSNTASDACKAHRERQREHLRHQPLRPV